MIGNVYRFRKGRGEPTEIVRGSKTQKCLGNDGMGEVLRTEIVYHFDNGLVLTATALTNEIKAGNAIEVRHGN